MPPEETTCEPVKMVSPLATPPDSTCSVPPLIRAPTSLPPELTTSTPPALTTVPLALPDTYWVPPLCTTVLLATPPLLTICRPLLLTVVPIAVPPWTICSPVLMVVPLAIPPLLTICRPLLTVVPIAVPPSTICSPGPVDDAAKLALAAVPNARLLSIQLLPGGGGIYMVAMNPEPYGNGAPQISAFVGPGAEVSGIVDPRTYSLGKRILVWLRVLHYGYGFGPIWTVLVFLSGFLPLLFGITGFRMWQLKQSRHASLPAASRAPSAAA